VLVHGDMLKKDLNYHVWESFNLKGLLGNTVSFCCCHQ